MYTWMWHSPLVWYGRYGCNKGSGVLTGEGDRVFRLASQADEAFLLWQAEQGLSVETRSCRAKGIDKFDRIGYLVEAGRYSKKSDNLMAQFRHIQVVLW